MNTFNSITWEKAEEFPQSNSVKDNDRLTLVVNKTCTTLAIFTVKTVRVPTKVKAYSVVGEAGCVPPP